MEKNDEKRNKMKGLRGAGQGSPLRVAPSPCTERYWSALLRCALHHGCRVMESAFLLSRGRGAGSLVGRAKVGRFVQGAPSRMDRWERSGGRVVAAVAGQGRAERAAGRCTRFSLLTEFLLAVVLQRRVPTVQTVLPTVEIPRCRSWSWS